MNKTYSKGELAEILAGLETDPEDRRIVYAPEKREIVIPLLYHGMIDAAIIPASHERARKSVVDSMQAQEKEMREFEHGPTAEQFFMRDGQLHFYESRRMLTAEEEAEIPGFVRESFVRLSDFIYPAAGTWTPRRTIRNFANHLAQGLFHVTFQYPGKADPAFTRVGWWLQDRFPDPKTNLMVFWKKALTGEDGAMPALHIDQGLTAHISGHNPMEYLVGGVSPDQWKALQQRLTGKDVKIEDDPEVRVRIRQLQVGDMVVFGEGFIHRSSSSVPDEGEMNVAAAPNRLWPHDL